MTTATKLEWKLEVIVVPVSDVDRAKAFYTEKCGFNVDVDHHVGDDWRVVQLTPSGSACSISIGKGLTKSAPGSLQGLQLVVTDIVAARAELAGRGVDVTPVRVTEKNSTEWVDWTESGRPPEWGSFFFFTDPDGNSWAVQQGPEKR